mgnify:CR=1 FL=1|tara:strand:+ start:3943 stop:5940 length:1998 start_codon:yes stop_codon:yes gene_type:complete
MAYKFQLGAARLSGSTTFEQALIGESTISGSGDLSLGADVILSQNGTVYLAGDGGAAKIVSTGGNNVSIFGANLVTNGAAILPDSDGGTNLGSAAKQFSTSFQSGLASLDGGINVNDDFTVDTDGGVVAVGINAGGALSGVTTLAASGLASVASISMDDGSTLGPDSVAGLWTFSADGDTTQADGAYDFDLASHDGTNGLKLGGVLVNASAADLNFTNVATAGTVEASKAVVVDASKDASGFRNLSASLAISASAFYGNGSNLTNVSSDSVDVADSSANSEFRLIGVAASGDGVALTTMDTAADRITMNALTGKLTVTGDVAANDIAAAGLSLSDLTTGRLPLVSTSGLLIDNADFVYDASRALNGYNTIGLSGSASGSAKLGDGLLFVGDTSDNDVLVCSATSFDLGYSVANDESLFTQHLGGGQAGEMNFRADNSAIHFGADEDVTLLHVHNVGLRLNAGMGLSLREGGININSDATGYLDIAAGTQVRFSTDVSGSGALQIGGTVQLDGADASVAFVKEDSMYFFDATTNQMRRDSWSDVMEIAAGAGITNTAGVLSVSAISTPTSFDPTDPDAQQLVEGLNYALGTINGARTLTLPDSDDLDPGEFVKIKMAAGGSATNTATIVIKPASSDLIDGDASIILESPYAAVSLYKVATNVWRIL